MRPPACSDDANERQAPANRAARSVRMRRSSADGDSTVVKDYVDYAPPLGPLGRLANGLLIAREPRSIFGQGVSLNYPGPHGKAIGLAGKA